MKLLKVLLCSLFLSLGYYGLNASQTNADTMAQGASSDDNAKTNSALIGIWQNQNDSRYYYEFRRNGEYIRYKIKEKGNKLYCQKLFGTYSVEGTSLRINFNGQGCDSHEFHIDNNTLIWFTGDRTIISKRVSQAEFNNQTKNCEWSY